MELWSEYRDDIHESHEAMQGGRTDVTGQVVMDRRRCL